MGTKIMATFDGSAYSEATLPQLEKLAALPGAEFLLFTVASEPHEQQREGLRGITPAVPALSTGAQPVMLEAPPPGLMETKIQAIESRQAQLEDYLQDIAARLPAGTLYRVAASFAENPASAIIKRALEEQPDLIVMATHGRTGIVHLIFGDVAEQVVRAGVAPVLLVHPDGVGTVRRGGS